MKVICSYCRADLGEKEPFDNHTVTHGICPACVEYFKEQWEGLDLGEFLDRFTGPVLVVDADGRILTANQRMADMLGKSDRQLSGLLGGEVMECRFARLPEGCGNTVHCKTCAIRNTVMAVMQSGEPLEKVKAYLNRIDREVELTISAYKRGPVVLLMVDEPKRSPGRGRSCIVAFS